MRQHIEDGLDTAVKKQLHLEDGHEQYNFRSFCRRITSIDIAINGTMAATKATGMIAKTATETEGTPATFTQSEVQSLIDKRINKEKLLFGKGKFGNKRKDRGNDKSGGNDKKPKKEDLKKEEDLPEIAKEAMMKRYYKPAVFKKRLEFSESGESKKEKFHLYSKDRWGFSSKERYACFSCRKTGHTADRCPSE